MKIIQAIPGMNIGGAERVVVNYAKLLPQHGHEVMVMSSGGVLIDELNYPGSSHIEAEFLFQRDAVSVAQSIGFLRKMLQEWKPDIIQAHSFISLVQLWLAVKTIRVCHSKMVYMIHVPEKDWVWSLIRYISPIAADKIITVSPYHYNALINWGFSIDKVAYVPNGLSISFDEEYVLQRDAVRKELGIPIDKFLVGTVCRLIERKGVHFLLESLAKVGNKTFGLIIGDGPDLDRLRALADSLGIADRVVFTGYRRDARRLMSSLDVFCSVSEWEAFPIVLLEAMEAKIPVVCFDWDGAREIMGNAACLVPLGDVPGLATAINELEADPLRRKTLGNDGNLLLRKRYTLEASIERLDHVYREAMES